MTFQTTVLWVAVFIFFAVLAFIGYNIYSSQYNTVDWPPFVSDCQITGHPTEQTVRQVHIIYVQEQPGLK